VTPGFREFLESKRFCGFELSPLMAAIADASDGVKPTSITSAVASTHFGCQLRGLPKKAPRTVGVRAGGRSGKSSRLVAGKAVHAAWTVPTPTTRTREAAVALLCAPDRALARQDLAFAKDIILESPVMSRSVQSETRDSITLKRPLDSKLVRIEVLAASRGGRATRGRTLVFAGLDEACFFLDESTGLVNDSHIYQSVLQRIVPGGQCWIVSTPWLEDVGLLESLVAKNFGVHDHALVVTAGTRALNPTWDPTREIEADLRATDPDAAMREIDGVPLAGGSSTFFDFGAIDACVDDRIPIGRAA
jgi:hypothetical protein